MATVFAHGRPVGATPSSVPINQCAPWKACADLNSDGIINILDVVGLVSQIMGTGRRRLTESDALTPPTVSIT